MVIPLLANQDLTPMLLSCWCSSLSFESGQVDYDIASVYSIFDFRTVSSLDQWCQTSLQEKQVIDLSYTRYA